MKIYINTDLEGVCSFVDWEEANFSTGRGIGYTKQFLTAEVNAAIGGILKEDKDAEIIVQDGHGGGYWGPNLLAEELHPRASLIQGKRGVELAELECGIDMLINIGAHSMAGTRHGLMNHTIGHNTIMNFWINDVLVGEIGIWAALAGYYGIPVGMVTGDYWAVEEARALLGDIPCVAVKKGINMYTAVCMNPMKARKQIKEAARAAVTACGRLTPYKVTSPVAIRIEYVNTSIADKKELNGAKRLDGRTVCFSGEDFITVFNRSGA